MSVPIQRGRISSQNSQQTKNEMDQMKSGFLEANIESPKQSKEESKQSSSEESQPEPVQRKQSESVNEQVKQVQEKQEKNFKSEISSSDESPKIGITIPAKNNEEIHSNEKSYYL